MTAEEYMFNGPDEMLEFVKSEGVEFIDVRFCDLIGIMQHFTIPASQLEHEAFEEGLAFDGSSVAGFQKINESDMALVPDPTSAWLDPFREHKTLIVNFFVHDPITHEPYSRDPRNIARKAMNFLASTGIGDTAFFAPEAEFYVFDDVRYETNGHESFYSVDSESAAWNTGRIEERGNLGYKVKVKGGYFPVAPTDHYGDLRDEMVKHCEDAGLIIERAHHEVGSAGQAEINWRYDKLLKSADDVMKFKYIVKNTAYQHGKTATFMPKPVYGDNGTGMHCHQSIWNEGEPLFFDENGYAQLSDMARYYIGGLLKHAPSLLAFTNPTVNSYHRLVPGFEAPVNLVYSNRNRSACIRIPITGPSPKAKRIEFRCPDPSANPYLAFAAQLLAGIDGIQNKIEPPAPIDKDLYELPPEEYDQVQHVPGSLGEVLDELEKDQDYLLAGDVFTPDLLSTWISLKRQDLAELAQRPHPYEFDLYYQI
ncbi:Glutamine synthetase [Propionibacterium freudenreichii]|jgi:glutamine synthetase|uniref:Glutamine synthetase n=2 Tax=Propionibacterium freudenreichii TaxID=1744 RepID=D7GEY4_PROFC|nr:Glutamine synthetase [Propionibacterium freudenreichii subsp. shermanii CIRM-BIA1]CDP49409.1 Glutamine synthetase [Propionibacterium freudenreichii subsp. freudenreichii]CEG86049.1 Glutamine synthetase [Propionibacterium freudenreichii]CEG91811.1 Glutamine synthetase [Propionibacterium freudenreichii]CEG93782.1 Glutamine synthetase [Propionibacterium freudenreichii]